MSLTVTDIHLEKIIRKAVNYGEIIGREGELMARGELPRLMRRQDAIKRLGARIYALSVENGNIKEIKINPEKRNSPIVVDRLKVIYVEHILLNQ